MSTGSSALFGIFPLVPVPEYVPAEPRVRKPRKPRLTRRKHPPVAVGDAFGPLTVTELVECPGKETVRVACVKGHSRVSRVAHLRRWVPMCIECWHENGGKK